MYDIYIWDCYHKMDALLLKLVQANEWNEMLLNRTDWIEKKNYSSNIILIFMFFFF